MIQKQNLIETFNDFKEKNIDENGQARLVLCGGLLPIYSNIFEVADQLTIQTLLWLYSTKILNDLETFDEMKQRRLILNPHQQRYIENDIELDREILQKLNL